jgi:putative membrane protein
MIYHLLSLVLGILTGIVTGLIPGLHINLIATALITSPIHKVQPTYLLIYITALSITHTFIDFIPSIYLGASSEDTSMSILPGHKYLLEGEGHTAVQYTIIGSSIAIMSLIVTIPLIYLISKTIYPFIEIMMGYILIWIIIILISTIKENKRWAIIIFILSGILGITTLNSNQAQPLLPLLSGLFGASTLIQAIQRRTIIPQQSIKKVKINKRELVLPIILTTLISPICSLLPGLGSSQAATLSTKAYPKISQNQFLILTGSINTLVISIAYITLYTLQKTRTGTAKAINDILTLEPIHITIIIVTIIITGCIVYPITHLLSRICAKNIHKINYSVISLIILLFLTFAVITLTGPYGLFTYIIATILGSLCIETQTPKSFLMGVILIPTTLYYLPF